MPKDLAIVLNHAGINSAVTAAIAAQKYRPIFLYGESVAGGQSRQRTAYQQQVEHFKPYREHSVAMPWAMQLVDPTAGPPTPPGDLRSRGRIEQRLIELTPLLAIAARFAEHHQARAIYTGLRVGNDSDELAKATEYLQVWAEMLQLPCGLKELEIQAPLLELEPWQVVDVGYQVAAPFELTWSCLGETATACGVCRACRGREQAFQQAGRPDPLKVAAR